VTRPAAETAAADCAEEVHPQAVAELAHGQRRIAARVEDLRSLTEREILACGDVLSRIVDHVRALVADTDHTVQGALARSESLTSRFVTEMQDDILAQENSVKQVLTLTDGIETAIDAINSLAQSSHMLAINARIEAARLGGEGRGVAVIADQMREMSKTVRLTADTVRASISALREGLPPVRERAASINERTRSFIEVMAEHVKSAARQSHGGSSTNRLDAVIELSNVALSHLQFQDPLAQKLASMDRDLEVLVDRVRRVLDGDVELCAIEDDRSSGGVVPAPGEVMLF
jgi:methyl-accepting chemotaxis protein